MTKTKRPRKLVLSSQTVVRLTSNQLAAAAGGTSGAPIKHTISSFTAA